MSQIIKFAPIVIGLAIGWLLFNPPAILSDLGPVGWLLNLGMCVFAFLLFVYWMILANLPGELQFEPVAEEELAPEQRALTTELQGMGFEATGPPLKVNVGGAAVLQGFVHGERPVYASVYRTGTVPPKVSYDFVSILHDDQGGLTTMSEPGGAALPSGVGGFRQVFPGEGPQQLFQRHLEGIAHLEAKGLGLRKVAAQSFRRDFSQAMQLQRRLFFAAPLRSTLITAWRGATKKVPFVGPVGNQEVAAKQIAGYLSGSRAGVY